MKAKTFLKKKMGVGELDTCYNRYQDILYYLGKVQLVQVQTFEPMEQNKEPKNNSQNSDT